MLSTWKSTDPFFLGKYASISKNTFSFSLICVLMSVISSSCFSSHACAHLWQKPKVFMNGNKMSRNILALHELRYSYPLPFLLYVLRVTDRSVVSWSENTYLFKLCLKSFRHFLCLLMALLHVAWRLVSSSSFCLYILWVSWWSKKYTRTICNGRLSEIYLSTNYEK